MMRGFIISGLLVGVIAIALVNSENDGAADAIEALGKNSTKASVDLTPTDVIFKTCNCTGGNVDCSDRNIEKFFTRNDWLGIVSMKPIVIDLSNNPIANVNQLLDQLPVEVFNLSRCKIESIERSAFKNLPKLRVLDLSYNKLTIVNLSPHTFEGPYTAEGYEVLSSMRELNLAHNDLDAINQDLFEHLPYLTDLDLSGNPLTTIDYSSIIAISSLSLLNVLKMRSCQLDAVPEKFLHTPRNLKRLDLSDNMLTVIPQELEETKNLIYLNLNQNPITVLEKDSVDHPGFPALENLEELHLCNMNQLTSIGEGTLGELKKLQKLHLSFNSKLGYIHPKALARVDDTGESPIWIPIKELYLHSNNLTEIDSRLLSRWDTLTALDVSNNPYLCDCSTQWMVDKLVNITERLQRDSALDLICQEPIEMRGKTMKHLNEVHSRMRCVDKYGNRPERDGAILLGTLIGVLLAVPIMLTIMLLWRRGYFSWCGIRGPADYSRTFYKRAQSDEFSY